MARTGIYLSDIGYFIYNLPKVQGAYNEELKQFTEISEILLADFLPNNGNKRARKQGI